MTPHQPLPPPSEQPPAPANPGRLGAWLAFTRPKTWLLAVAPVLAALALAWAEAHAFSPVVALLTLTIAVLMQAISNMENDLGYSKRKAETGNRRGLPRATTMGWISNHTAEWAIRMAAVLAMINTAALIYFGGWPFALVGAASLTAAYCYMGGPKPIAYTPFGEVLVLLFFGLTAVCGTYYLQTSELTINCILLGAALGTIASGVLAVNNFRDREHDESIGRRTLAVLIGEKSFLRLFDALLLIPYALVALMVVTDISRWPYFLVILSLPLAMRVSQQIRRSQHEALNEVMFGCVQLEARFALLFAIGASAQAVLMSLTLSNMVN